MLPFDLIVLHADRCNGAMPLRDSLQSHLEAQEQAREQEREQKTGAGGGAGGGGGGKGSDLAPILLARVEIGPDHGACSK